MNTQFDIAFIRSKKPCYNPAIYLPEGWKGSVKGLLRHRDMPAKDKLWVVLRKELIDDKTLRLFAVACARRALTSAVAATYTTYAAYDADHAAYAAANRAAYVAYAAAGATAAAYAERQWQINLLITMLEVTV